MNRQRLMTACVVFTVLCLAPVLAYGQDEPQEGRADLPQRRTSLLIINGSDSTKVNFSVKNGDGNWVPFSLDPHKDISFRNTTNIMIATTNGKRVEYRLEYANRYRIYWNRAEECWDVTRLLPR